MRLYSCGAIFVALFVCHTVSAQSPPYSTITITGKTDSTFNKVSLFENGRSRTPFKTEDLSPDKYSIDADIPDDLHQKDDYFYTDMRFWQDKNDNGTRDPDEPMSQCHFIIWMPSHNKIIFQVYQGTKNNINSSTYKYDYEKDR